MLLIAAIALCAVGIWAALRLAAAADSVKKLADDVEARAPELLEKADVTVDALNVELLRMDLIITQVEEVTELVSSASNAVHTIVNAPYEVVTGLGERLRRSLHAPRKQREHHESRKPLGSGESEDRPPMQQEPLVEQQPAIDQSLVDELTGEQQAHVEQT